MKTVYICRGTYIIEKHDFANRLDIELYFRAPPPGYVWEIFL